jgi:cobalamin-dependent methionine synthase I
MPDRWGGVTALGLAVCTVGAAIEDRIESLFKEGEFPLAFMLDSLGSVATECLAEGLHRQVCTERLAQGLKVSPRVSPGYPRWAIEEQRKIFALLPADAIGIHLNPYAIMTPRKSISFAVGIGPEVHMGTGQSPCTSCDMRGCAYRRAPRRQGHPSPWVSEVAPLVLSSQAEPRR